MEKLKLTKNNVNGYNTTRLELQHALKQIPNLPNHYKWILELKHSATWMVQYGHNYGITLHVDEIKELNELWKNRKK